MLAFIASNDTPQTLGNNRAEEYSRDDGDDEEEAAKSLMPDIERRHYLSTAAICLCTFTHSWLLVSIFPYSGFMVIRLVPGTDEENAGSHAGLLAASFMIGRALTSYGWGRAADIYGRRIVFFISLVFSAIFSFLFGLSSTFGLALLWRFFLGASNGVAGAAKAVVSETAEGNEELETRGMSMSMGMWAWGFLLSPAISGFLSDPIRQYPGLSIWSSLSSSSQDEHSLIYKLLQSYPFLLPNLISVLLCAIDLIAVVAWVPETLPSQDLRSASNIPGDVSTWLTSALAGDTTNITRNTYRSSNIASTNHHDKPPNDGMIHEEDSDGDEAESLLSNSTEELELTQKVFGNREIFQSTNTNADSKLQDLPEAIDLSYLWSKIDTRNHLIVFWIFSFVAIAIDEAFPLFCISKEGGLGLSEGEIGKLLSATGVIFAISQYHVYAWIIDRYGLRRSIQIGAMLSAPLVTFVPISLLFNNARNDTVNDEDAGEEESREYSSANSELTWLSFIYLSLLLSFIRIFGLVFFSSITIATNRTVIPSHRGTMNGLSMLGGSVAKGLGPIFAGSLISSSISSGVISPKAGAVLVFVVIGACSTIAVGVTFYLLVDGNHIIIHHTDNKRDDCRSSDEIECAGTSTNDAFQQPLLRDTIVLRQSKERNVV